MSRPPLRVVRISAEGRDQLIRLKRFTQIQHWNVLCRWALMRSLSEEHPPAAPLSKQLSALELDWEVFAGPLGDLPILLVRQYNHDHGLGTDDETVADQLRRHLHRGIAALASAGEKILSVEDLVAMVTPPAPPAAPAPAPA